MPNDDEIFNSPYIKLTLCPLPVGLYHTFLNEFTLIPSKSVVSSVNENHVTCTSLYAYFLTDAITKI